MTYIILPYRLYTHNGKGIRLSRDLRVFFRRSRCVRNQSGSNHVGATRKQSSNRSISRNSIALRELTATAGDDVTRLTGDQAIGCTQGLPRLRYNYQLEGKIHKE